jgi:DNA topoisomerase-1
MSKSLVIVESPTKIKTITKILGDKFKVVSSMGHLIDLPKSKMGVDIEGDFAPQFIVVRSKQKVLTQLKKDAKNKKDIYIATDPDREGEAIGWNLANALEGDGKKFHRVTFQEITKEAVLKAFEHPRPFDKKKIKAQVARRVLDRIVGYEISPLLWKKVGSRLSAGRVQSVALRLIVDREKAIKAFVPQEYWQITADLKKEGFDDVLCAALERIGGEKFELKSKEETDVIVQEIGKEKFTVTNVTRREVRRNPSPPYITSTLQQDAFNKLGFNANKTMMIAQQLYEGIEIGKDEPVGLITYMRTDSVNISKEALEKARNFINKEYGEKYLPETPNKYKSKKSAQEAHEAIRPSDVTRRPEAIKQYLDEAQYKLYELIWRRFLSCQMTPAVYEQRKIEITAGPPNLDKFGEARQDATMSGGRFQFGVSGSTLLFDGYQTLTRDPEEEGSSADFSHFTKDDKLRLVEVKPSQHFTKPPPRYSDASLVKDLEEDGIGRPSTYASIIQTLVYRNYVRRERGYFIPTELGIHICDMLIEYFPRIMDIGFTAKMEEDLDQIEEGDLDHVKLLKEFYGPFKEHLDHASENIVKTQNFVDRNCPECGRRMVVKWGRKGKFLSCSGFPECRFAQPFMTGVKCPEPDCAGELVERRSHRGVIFFGCSRYPECKHISNKLPEEEK